MMSTCKCGYCRLHLGGKKVTTPCLTFSVVNKYTQAFGTNVSQVTSACPRCRQTTADVIAKRTRLHKAV